MFYRQQYSAAYFGHLHQEVEPKKEGKGLLLTHRVGAEPINQSINQHGFTFGYIFMPDACVKSA